MFTGIIQALGNVKRIIKAQDGSGDFTLQIGLVADFDKLVIGESICVNGVCLTLVEFNNEIMSFDVCNETILKTNFNQLAVDSQVNLERSMKLGDGISGHLVSGHIDYVAQVKSVENDGFSVRMGFLAPIEVDSFLVPKGSIAINGISLTLVNVHQEQIDNNPKVYFDIALIPHTLEHTNLKNCRPGDLVNIETDLIARHIAKLCQPYLMVLK